MGSLSRKLNSANSSFWVAAFIASICLGILGFTGWREWTDRAAVLQVAEVQVSNFARSLVQHGDDSFDLLDTSIIGIVNRLETFGFDSGATGLSQSLAARKEGLPRLHGLVVCDENGEWLTASGPLGPNLSNREYFLHHKQSPSRDALVGRPIKSSTRDSWIISVSRRLNHSDGSFAGVVLATISSDYFSQFYQQFETGAHGAILLVRANGIVLARSPDNEIYVGRDVSSTLPLQQVALGSPSGTYYVKSSLDGRQRVGAYKRSTRFPIVVLATLDLEEQLAPWRKAAIARTMLVLTLTALIAIIGFYLVRQLRQRQGLVSALKARADALRAAKDAAEAASRTKSDFLAMMSHEIRTPMAGMMGMLELLSGTRLDQEQQDLADVAQESARNLLAVVNNILDFSKLEAGQVTPEAIDFSVERLINSVAVLLGAKARGQGLALQTSLAEGMPRWLNGDPSRLGQILLNLVGNAIKFTEIGSVTIAASSRALSGGTIELRIEVIDTGAGISKEIQNLLFNPFVQADISVARKYGGTGLGLAICKQLCRTMGGDIEVESEPGRGSNFWLTVPCRLGLAPELAAPALVPKFEPKLEPELDTASIDILVAEDNDIIRTLISKLLARHGYHADLVCNGTEAVEAVQKKRYHLVLMDMQMPQMDGITATETIRALSGPEREVPIIALTANALVGQREICLAAGMNSFLTKPIQPDALFEAILQWGGAKADRHAAPQSQWEKTPMSE